MRRAGCVALAVLVAASVFGGPAAEAAAPTPSVTLFVELDQPSAFDQYRERLARDGKDAARKAAVDARSAIAAKVDALLATFRGSEVTGVVFRTTNAVPGVAVRATEATARELADEPGVRSVRRITTVRPGNASADQLGRTVNAWQQTGRLGTGVRIGLVDTGIDYTHADFGGPGTVAAYRGIDPIEADPATFPTAKVVGGVDLAGDAYDADSSDQSATVPQPDDDPLDCEGHGTHVAGTAAGLGENADGTTFRGDYRSLTPAALDGMRIGPGAAPGASLYAIKVFGCSGSTALTAEGLDQALDPNGDGDFSDRLDVVNLSLGSSYGAVDDPVNDFVKVLTDNGVLVVAAGGNSGDLYDSGGAPGTSPDALAVASVRDAGSLLDAVEVPGAGTFPGQYSVDFPGYAGLDRTAPVVEPGGGDAQGCGRYDAADAQRVRDAVVWLDWPDAGPDGSDPRRRCGSAARADAAAAAGAAGVLLTSTQPDFGSTRIAGDDRIPMFQMTGPTTAALRPLLAAGTLRVRFAGASAASDLVALPGLADTVSPFSSRGLHGAIVKPDVAAPGDTITSALSGSGTGRQVESGTSMASPFVAGVAALVREAHPDWTPADVKAAIMDTATADVYAGQQRTGPVLGPMRVGAGRIDAAAAVATTVLAADATRPGAVGVGFGVVEVPPGAPLGLRRQVQVRNLGRQATTFAVSYAAATTMPGATISVAPARVTVPAGGSALVDVRLGVPDPAAMRRTADPSLALVQDGAARQYLADASGRVVLTPIDGPAGPGGPLRVPVAAAPKPVSTLTARLDGDRVTLGGTGVAQGSGAAAYRSFAGVFALAAQSPRLPLCAEQQTSGCVVNATGSGGDLRWVGVAATATGMLGVAVVTWADLADVGTLTVPSAELDVDGDGAPDFVTRLETLPDTDVLVARTTDVHGTVVDTEPVNGYDGATDTNVFDTDTWVLPVRLAALGIDPARAGREVGLRVVVHGQYGAPGSADQVVDSTDRVVRVDPHALLTPASALLLPAAAGTVLPVPSGTTPLVVLNRNGTGARAVLPDAPG